MEPNQTPRIVRQMLIGSGVFLLATLVLTGFNAYVTFAAPERQVAGADQPSTIGFQGYLEENGSPVTGTKSITFTLYDAATGGNSVWSETQGTVSVENGLYSVQLGSSTALDPDDFDDDRWLGVTVQGDSEMTPRIPISAVPWAYNARQAMGLQGQPVSTASPQSGDILSFDGTEWGPLANRILDGGTNQIANGAITVQGGHLYQVDGEFGDPSDTLTTINGTQEGDTVYLIANSGDSITLDSGTGNIIIPPDADWVLSDSTVATLINIDGTNLVAVNRQSSFMSYSIVEEENSNTISDNGETLSFSTEHADTDNYHDVVTNPERLTAPYDGLYLVSHGYLFGFNSNQDKLSIKVRVNGANQAAEFNGGSGASFTITGNQQAIQSGGSGIVYLSAGDYVTLYADSKNGTGKIDDVSFSLTLLVPG